MMDNLAITVTIVTVAAAALSLLATLIAYRQHWRNFSSAPLGVPGEDLLQRGFDTAGAIAALEKQTESQLNRVSEVMQDFTNRSQRQLQEMTEKSHSELTRSLEYFESLVHRHDNIVESFVKSIARLDTMVETGDRSQRMQRGTEVETGDRSQRMQRGTEVETGDRSQRMQRGAETQLLFELWTAHTNLAMTWASLGNSMQAIQLYREALKVVQEVGPAPLVAQSLLNLAIALRDSGKLEESLKLNEEALNISRHLKP